jgi:site-specific recombinase XerD
MHFLGHSNVQTTERYSHVRLTKQKDVDANLDAKIKALFVSD